MKIINEEELSARIITATFDLSKGLISEEQFFDYVEKEIEPNIIQKGKPLFGTREERHNLRRYPEGEKDI